MLEDVIARVGSGVITLIVYITVGIALGWLLEILGIIRGLARLAAPIIRRAALPPVCAGAFVTALASPKAAAAMLSAAHANGEIGRRSLILGATANSFPSAMMRLRTAAPLLIVTLGGAGLAYVLFVVAGSLCVLTTAILLARFWPASGDAETSSVCASQKSEQLVKTNWKTAFKRWRHLLPKVLMVAVPVYTFVAILNETGVFKALSKKMPPGLESVYPAEAIAVIAMQMASTSRAVPVAKEFLDAGALTTSALFFSLVGGYVISLPLRIIRRTLPSALSIYPGRNGVFIILLSQVPRFLLGVVLVIIWIVIRLA